MMKRFLKISGSLLLVVIIILSVWIFSNLRDHNPGYKADLKIINRDISSLKAGFAAVKITPEVPDKWIDKNGDAKYRKKDGDTFIDGNGNGVFDPVWIAGFSNGRAANGIHDDLWARTIVIDDGKTRIAVVVLDAIGFMNDEVIDVRKRISAESDVSYTIITSTHSHEAPDLLGLWGETPLKSGISKKYMEYVKDQAAKSVNEAVKNMRPAILAFSEDVIGAIPLVKDTRSPEVYDSGMRIIKAVDRENGKTLGSLVAWADHAETLWSRNLLITSDFAHYFREGVEKGVFSGDSLIKPGIGGICVYVNGAVGGLMTTHPSLTVRDPVTGKEYNEPTYEKAEAQGKMLSLVALNSMDKPAEIIDSAAISAIVKTISLPIDNKMFRIATATGILDRGTAGWMKMRSELAVLTIGPLSIATIPGEIYPEIVNGGIESPAGQDFSINPVEVPSVREIMPGKYKLIFCLANDEIGYILPKSQWDVEPPFTYGRKDSPYGEENSLGPETAPLIYAYLSQMLSGLK
jgi:hypothetical protein